MSEELEAVMVGPWGGRGGSNWKTNMNNAVGIDSITIRHGLAIDSLKVKTINGNGEVKSSKIGGKGGDKTNKITMDYPAGEKITHVEGRYGAFYVGGPVVVTMLTFITDRGSYGPYGHGNGSSFLVPIKTGNVVGFHGTAGQYIDSIGICMKPIRSNSINAIMGADNMSLRRPWIWGGVGGKPWDDGAFSGIKRIVITRGEDAIYSIAAEYVDSNGKTVVSPEHGRSGGIFRDQIKFEDHSKEYLGSISGFYGPVADSSGFEVIKSLTFHTNERKYGPFGKEIGKFFSSDVDGKAVGFVGRNGHYLDALGLHIEYS